MHRNRVPTQDRVRPEGAGLADGLRVHCVVDACGGSSGTAHDTALRWMESEGMVPRTWLQWLLELQRDWTRSATYKDATDTIKTHGGAYGIGLQYASSMLAPPAS